MSTIHDVARAANVSITTVSRVMNGDARVHPTLRRAVEAAVHEIGYRPNAAARSLRLARTSTIGVVVPSLGNPVMPEIVHGIGRGATERGLGLFLCDSNDSTDQQGAHLQRLHERRVDGVIIYPAGPYAQQIAPLQAAGLPVVVIGQRVARGDGPQVVVDESDASYRATRSLLDLGHRHIAFIAPASASGSRARWGVMGARVAVLKQAHRDAGVPVDPSFIVAAEDSRGTQAAAAALMRRADRPTAVIVGRHAETPAVLLAIKELGLTVPRDVSLVAYGDSCWAEVFDPPISVVRSDYEAFGRRAIDLLQAISDGLAEMTIVHHPAEFVPRGSYAPPPTNE